MKKPVTVSVLVLLMTFGATAIPLINSIQTSEFPLADREISHSNLNIGSIDLSVDFKTIHKNSDISSGNWNHQTATFKEQNITRNASGKTSLDLNLESNPGWIWFKVDQTANLENERISTEFNNSQAFYQLDFAQGGVIKDLSKDNLYGNRLIWAYHGRTFDENTLDSGSEEQCIDLKQVDVDNENLEATASFELKNCEEKKELTFASYEKPSGGGFKEDEADQQELIDYETKKYGNGTFTKTVKLPLGEIEGDKTEEEGELGDILEFTVWYDDGDGDFESDEQMIFEGTAHEFGKFNEYEGLVIGKGGLLDGKLENQGRNELDPFASGTSHLGIKWKMPEDAPCTVQTDEKRFDFTLVTQQSRHNKDPGKTWKAAFGDREKSEDNFFLAGKFPECETQEEPPETVCEDTEVLRGTPGQREFNTEITGDNSIKFEGGLGDSERVETEVFTIEVEGNAGEVVYIRTKSGQLIGTAMLNGEGDVQMDTSGQYYMELLEVVDKENTTEYRIEVTTIGEEGKEIKELSNIEFQFCEPIEKKAYWQIDLSEEGVHVPGPGYDDPLLVMAALSDEFRGGKVKEGPINPSHTEGSDFLKAEPEKFFIDGRNATAQFEIDSDEEGAAYLSVYEMKGAHRGWTDPTVDEQQLHDVSNGSFEPGERHNLTAELPGGMYPAPGEIEEEKEPETVFKAEGPYDFDGDDHEVFPHDEKMELTNGSLKMSFEMDDETENWIFSKDRDGCDGSCGHLSIAHESSFINDEGLGVRLQTGRGEDAYLEPQQEIEEDKEYNLTVTWGQKGARLFLNGEIQDRDTTIEGIQNNGNQVVLGKRYDDKSGTGLDGRIEDVRMLDRELTKREINLEDSGE